jgi:hypothetical protein
VNSRIRTIKPEWRTDRKLHEAGLAARVLSVCLITMSDDEGRGHFREAVLAAECFEHEENPSRTFREALAKLSGWFLTVYTVRGERYWQLVNWHAHQRVDKPRPSRIPAPENADPAPEKTCDSAEPAPIREDVANDSRNSREGVAPGPWTVDRGPGIVDRGVNPPNPPAGGEGGGKPKRSEATAAEREVFEHWRSTFRKSAKAKLDPKRKRRIAWALDAYGIEAVKRAIDGYAADPWTRGQNDRGRAYDDLSLLLRDAEHVERGLEFADGKGPRLSGRLPVSTGWGDADTKASQAEFDEMFPPLEAAHG